LVKLICLIEARSKRLGNPASPTLAQFCHSPRHSGIENGRANPHKLSSAPRVAPPLPLRFDVP